MTAGAQGRQERLHHGLRDAGEADRAGMVLRAGAGPGVKLERTAQ